VTKSGYCQNCGTEMPMGDLGRPRRYCSAACRQAAYRSRTLATATGERMAMVTLAGRLRDNADRLWMLSQGWVPPSGQDGVALVTLLTETVEVAEEMARRGRALGDGIRDSFPSGSLE
jgi:hypothetical protein